MWGCHGSVVYSSAFSKAGQTAEPLPGYCSGTPEGLNSPVVASVHGTKRTKQASDPIGSNLCLPATHSAGFDQSNPRTKSGHLTDVYQPLIAATDTSRECEADGRRAGGGAAVPISNATVLRAITPRIRPAPRSTIRHVPSRPPVKIVVVRPH